jgi:hypothetical protein
LPIIVLSFSYQGISYPYLEAIMAFLLMVFILLAGGVVYYKSVRKAAPLRIPVRNDLPRRRKI